MSEPREWIRCNHCGTEFREGMLDVDAYGPNTGETCPACGKGDALMDLSHCSFDLRLRVDRLEAAARAVVEAEPEDLVDAIDQCRQALIGGGA